MTHTVAEHLIGWLPRRIWTLVAPSEAAAEAPTCTRFDHLTQADASELLVRAIRRLQHHQVFLARTTNEPLPEPVRGRLEEHVVQIFAETATFLEAAAAGLTNYTSLPSLCELKRSSAAYTAAFAGLHREGVIGHLPREEASRVEALSIRLDELRQDLESFVRHAESINR